jgi:predicted RNase H-like nuclease
MRFIGVDLAWQSDKNHSGAAVLHGGADGASLVAISDRLLSIEAVVEFITSHADGDAAVAIDAPLIITNKTGQRPCETEVGRRFGRYKASAHTSNLTRYPHPGSVRLANALQRQGFSHDVAPRADQFRTGQWFFEVYPHPAHIVLFQLPERLLYKKGRVAQKRKGLETYRRLVGGMLPQANPPLRGTANLDHMLNKPLDQLKGQDLKHYEDVLDALFCAYLALYYWRWGHQRNEMIGDLTSGYIINPTQSVAVAKSASDT